MPQNLMSLSFTKARLAALDDALSIVEAELVDLVSLPVAQRRELF